MLHKDNIISACVSEAIEKVTSDEKDYLLYLLYSAPLCVLLCTATAYKEQTKI